MATITKTMTKKQRQEVFEKYGGKCAYSGKPLLDDWQVDHIEHKSSWRFKICDNEGRRLNDPDHIENLVPCAKIINHYKRAKNLEEFRLYMMSFHIRLAKLPKNTRVRKRAKTKEYMLSIAAHFGITTDMPFTGLFYFESPKQQP